MVLTTPIIITCFYIFLSTIFADLLIKYDFSFSRSNFNKLFFKLMIRLLKSFIFNFILYQQFTFGSQLKSLLFNLQLSLCFHQLELSTQHEIFFIHPFVNCLHSNSFFPMHIPLFNAIIQLLFKHFSLTL